VRLGPKCIFVPSPSWSQVHNRPKWGLLVILVTLRIFFSDLSYVVEYVWKIFYCVSLLFFTNSTQIMSNRSENILILNLFLYHSLAQKITLLNIQQIKFVICHISNLIFWWRRSVVVFQTFLSRVCAFDFSRWFEYFFEATVVVKKKVFLNYTVTWFVKKHKKVFVNYA
jgi:hypothetical protein